MLKHQKNVHQTLLEEYCRTHELKKVKQLWRETKHLLCINVAYTLVSRQLFDKANNKPMLVWMQALGKDHLSLKTVEHSFSYACGANNMEYIEYMHRLNQTRHRTHPFYLDEYVYIHSFFAACKHGQKQVGEYLLDVYKLLKRPEYLNQGIVVAQQENQHEMVAWIHAFIEKIK